MLKKDASFDYFTDGQPCFVNMARNYSQLSYWWLNGWFSRNCPDKKQVARDFPGAAMSGTRQTYALLRKSAIEIRGKLHASVSEEVFVKFYSGAVEEGPNAKLEPYLFMNPDEDLEADSDTSLIES